MNDVNPKSKRITKNKQTKGKGRQRAVTSSSTPQLFMKNVRLPTPDPFSPTDDILEELRETAPSKEVFKELVRFYPKIRTRIIESTKTFRYSDYRLRLPADNESRTSEIKDFIEKVIDRQSVGASFNIGTGAILNEKEPDGSISYRHWHSNPTNSAFFPTAKFITTRSMAKRIIDKIDMTSLLAHTHFHAAETSSTNLEMVRLKIYCLYFNTHR